MAAEYARITARSREDPGTAGDEGEENWAELLRDWLPSTYHVKTKGRILSEVGLSSPQVDVLVLSPAYPPALLNRKQSRVWRHRGLRVQTDTLECPGFDGDRVCRSFK